jgi:hypothetical protein
MPSNHILINNSMEYSVPDSKMDNLLQWLGDNADTTNTGLRKESDEIIDEAISYSQS